MRPGGLPRRRGCGRWARSRGRRRLWAAWSGRSLPNSLIRAPLTCAYAGRHCCANPGPPRAVSRPPLPLVISHVRDGQSRSGKQPVASAESSSCSRFEVVRASSGADEYARIGDRGQIQRVAWGARSTDSAPSGLPRPRPSRRICLPPGASTRTRAHVSSEAPAPAAATKSYAHRTAEPQTLEAGQPGLERLPIPNHVDDEAAAGSPDTFIQHHAVRTGLQPRWRS